MGSNVPIKNIPDTEKEKHVKEMIDLFTVDDATLREMMKTLLKEMDLGLSSEGSQSSLRMLPSFVRSTPNGKETGNYLALDLGGTNFRVLVVKLDGKKSDLKSKIYPIPQEIMIGSGEKLFDHIASCLHQFVQEISLEDQRLPLGFTFSFALKQEGLTSGKLINWSKGFNCSGVIGKDVVKMLEEACERRKDLHIDIVAVLNDTVGTLMSLGHTDNKCYVGVIVGTGTNACYLEKLSKCPKLANLMKTDKDEMIINMEWGGFGDNGTLGKIVNKFDNVVDSLSINPGQYTFEKIISGMYMGEHVRLSLRDLAEKGVIFSGKDTSQLAVQNSFTTKDISDVENDATEKDTAYSRTIKLFNKMGIKDIGRSDSEIVHKLCQAISLRSANLCAAGIAVLLNRMRRPQVTVGVDGSVYRFHPKFKTYLDQKINQLIDKDLKFKLKLSEDGSGRGAALVAAVAKRLRDEEDSSKSSKSNKAK